jgi:hypothetical protein
VGECSTILEVLPKSPLGGQIFWEIALAPIAILLFGVHRWVSRNGRHAL